LLCLDCTAADVQETERKRKKKEKKEKKKKKKKKKDRSRSRSRSREAAKLASSTNQVSSHNNRDASPLVRVKSEFPEDIRKHVSRDRKHGEKHLAGDKNDVRVKEEVDRRKVNSANDYSPQCRGRATSPQRRGKDIGTGHDRGLGVDGSQSAYYVEKRRRREPNDEGRSSPVKTEGRSQHCRDETESKPSTKKRIEEVSGQRDGRGKRHMRSSSADESEDRWSSGVIEQKRSHQHRSADRRDPRQKIRRNSRSSSDDDSNWT